MEDNNKELSVGEIKIGLDLVDLVHGISRKNKKFSAILLSDMENILGKDSDQFKEIRALVLDSYNAYTRSLLRIIFGQDFDI